MLLIGPKRCGVNVPGSASVTSDALNEVTIPKIESIYHVTGKLEWACLTNS